MAIGTVWADDTWESDAWADDTWADAGAGQPNVGDLNAQLMVYLRDYYSVSGGDLTTLATRYMNELTTGDRNQKFLQMVQDALDAM